MPLHFGRRFGPDAGRMLARNAAKPGDRRGPQSRFGFQGLYLQTLS